MLSRMSFSEHPQAEFRRLVDNEANLIETAAKIENVELRRRLMDVLALMVLCDGNLAERERAFLMEITIRLEVPLDLDEVESRTGEYRVTVKRSMPEKAASSIKDTATKTDGKMQGTLGKIFKRRTDVKIKEFASEGSLNREPHFYH